jgi:hypothetical protein
MVNDVYSLLLLGRKQDLENQEKTHQEEQVKQTSSQLVPL